MKQTLFIYGDSFAYHDPNDVEYKTWPFLVASGISTRSESGVDIRNFSMAGTSQDWTYKMLRSTMYQWKPNDVVVVCLTDSARFWFNEDKPQMSNINTVGLDNHLASGMIDAIQGYYRWINRPQLDALMVDERLGSLAYWVDRTGVRCLVLPCFEQQAGDLFIGTQENSLWHYNELDLAQGSLMYVQQSEWEQVNNKNYHSLINWYGYELRAMHLCQRNHHVLADKVVDWAINRETVDLRSDFHKNFIPKNFDIQPELEVELNRFLLEKYRKR
jgi:hypothetical protein